MTLYTDPVTAMMRDASIVRTYLENGSWPFDRCCVLMYHMFPEKAYNRFGIYKRHWIPYDASMKEQIQMIRHLAPSVLEGYPSRLFSLATAVRESGIMGISPKLVFTNSETLYDWIKTEIEAVFGTAPTVVYDCWEFGHIAWMCSEKKGLHVNEDLLVVEILREDGTATEPGESGEVVVTDLFNKGMPLIRYAMGDRSAWSEEPCACGHPFPTIKSVMGRMSEVFIRGDGSRLMTTMICEMLLSTEGIREFQAVQEVPGELVFYIVADDRFGDQKQKILEQKAKNAFGFSSIEVRRVKKIEKTTSGKLKSIVPLGA
jgi:phenylacetate-CoA ligase